MKMESPTNRSTDGPLVFTFFHINLKRKQEARMTSFPRYSELLNETKARRKICGWLVWGFDGCASTFVWDG